MPDWSDWTQITTKDDFPNVSVSKKNNAHVYHVDFFNYEGTAETKQSIGLAVLLPVCALCVYSIFTDYPLLILLIFPAIIIYALFVRSREVKRTIELNFDSDLMQLYKNDKPDGGNRKVTRLYELTVEDHPDTEWERVNRQQNQKKGPGPLEKTHCLFAWFGEGGAEKIRLIDRIEWPKRNSLFEVQQAVNYAYQLGMNEAAQKADSGKAAGAVTDEIQISNDGSEISLGNMKIRGEGDTPKQPDNDKGRGIKPPLD